MSLWSAWRFTSSRRGRVVAAVVDAAAAPPGSEATAVDTARSRRGDAKATAARCAGLEVNQKWQDLHDCAGELAGLARRDRSVATKAEEFVRRRSRRSTPLWRPPSSRRRDRKST